MEYLYNIISSVLSIIAIGFSLYTYYVYDRKLKKQEHLIHTYQLRQFQSEEQENKKADIVGEISLIRGEKYILNICNKGRASAKNIHIEGFDIENYSICNIAILPYKCLNSNETFSLNIFRIRRSIPTMTITYIWDDDWGNNRKKQQTIQMR